ncbi:MAG TPA: glycosyltransferase family 39 protein [Aggregatilineaceae bacterium]|nr:glycosyltransferase family 39 protein [Aggregatilineaceae bacterium]
MKLSYKLGLICLGAFLLRAALLIFVKHPGIADPNHYYNLGRQIIAGNGLETDYLWHYYNPPDHITHPDDFWMPFAGVIAAGGMALFGTSVQAAILPFILLGSLLPLVSYASARQIGLSETAGLISAAFTAVLPELVLNSLRTNTPIPSALFLSTALLLLVHGLKHCHAWALIGCGLLVGLAYLTRSEVMLFFPILALILLFLSTSHINITRAALYGLLISGATLIVITPMLLRNVHETGSLTTPHLSRIFFMTDVRDFYSYGRDLNWQTLRENQTIPQMAAKRLFEMAASVKMMLVALDVVLPVAVVGGLIMLFVRREKVRLLLLAPTLILLVAFFLFYTILAPYNNQGGAFKKSYLSLLSLLIPLGAYAIEQAIADSRVRFGAVALALALMTANAVEMMRSDITFTNNYVSEMKKVVKVVNSLPDTNSDGEIVLMAQDQFMLRFLGIRSVMIPMEDRDSVLEVANRYHVDYLMMPPARPSLDPLYDKDETDPRFVYVCDVPGTVVEIYRFDEGK